MESTFSIGSCDVAIADNALRNPEGIIPYTVTALSQALKTHIEAGFARIHVKGEIVGVTIHASGHAYFSLKDATAMVEVVLWRPHVPRYRHLFEGELEVIITGKITAYGARSRYQLVAEKVIPSGEGSLMKLLNHTKEKLRKEGLFDPGRKRALPAYPLHIGLITSSSGSVLHDMLHRLQARWPCRVTLFPVAVQGPEAVPSMLQVFAFLASHLSKVDGYPLDAVILARGGGSFEDLWPFQDESLVRAVAALPLPIITAIGHETDTTLVDFASDLRAPTPTAAVELVTPVLEHVSKHVESLILRALQVKSRIVDRKRQQIAALIPEKVLPAYLASKQGILAHLALRLDNVWAMGIARAEASLKHVKDRLKAPQIMFDYRLLSFQRQEARFIHAVQHDIEHRIQRLHQLSLSLSHLGPKEVLKRGFAIVARGTTLVGNPGEVRKGDLLTVHFAEGCIEVVVSSA